MSPADKQMKTAVAYVRVSAPKGRKEGGLGAADQRRDIEAWAQARGVTIVAWEQDGESGGNADRPALERAIKAVKAKDADGIVVSALDRLSRLGVPDALALVERIILPPAPDDADKSVVDGAGGTLAAIDLGIDPTTPTGELILTFMLALGRWERRLKKDALGSRKAEAIENGWHVGSAPLGYNHVKVVNRNGQEVNGPLVPNEHAPLVRELFLRRAAGASWMELVGYLEKNGVRVSKSSVGYTLSSRTYRGEIAGGTRDVEVHEALVTEKEWEAAQRKKGERTNARNGTVASEGIVAGLVTCAECGGRLTSNRNGAPQPDGLRAVQYQCKGHTAAHGPCEARASVKAAALDHFVEVAIGCAANDGTLHTTLERREIWNAAQRRVDEAKAAVAKLTDHRLLSAYTIEELAGMREGAQADLDEARRVLRDTPRPDATIELDNAWYEDERWTVAEKRQLVRSLVSRLTLRKGKGLPIAERVEITWAGHDEPDATLAARIAAGPFQQLTAA